MSSQLLLACSVLVLAPAAALHQQQRPEDWGNAGIEANEWWRPGPRENALKQKDPFHLIPKGDTLCLEGGEAYLQSALQRLQESNMRPGWNTSKVESGTCLSVNYATGPITENCFPRSTIWSDGDVDHNHEKMDMDFVKAYASEHQDEVKADRFLGLYPVIECMYEVEDAKASKKIHHLVAKNHGMCLEGPGDYLHLAKKHLGDSNMQTGWKESQVESGPCEPEGYTVQIDEFPGTASEIKFCFPKLHVWSDPTSDVDIVDLGTNFVKEYNEQHPDQFAMDGPLIECMDRVGSIW